ncbi:hypothetical protein B0H16DRAFT_1471316 [Mycena metata]|uniref:Uncharacterized protein n=1 Tax=Mycena metata TaxID=1033252 RepID=A0AAD7HRL3_9AGAR|nr:hypothetical protein B0H16DRAFT_1471316 [Mycena metata]
MPPLTLDEPRRRLRLTPAPSDPTAQAAQRKPALSVEHQPPSPSSSTAIGRYLLLEALMPVLAIRRHGHLRASTLYYNTSTPVFLLATTIQPMIDFIQFLCDLSLESSKCNVGFNFPTAFKFQARRSSHLDIDPNKIYQAQLYSLDGFTLGLQPFRSVPTTFTLYCCDSSCFSPTGFGLIFGENYRQDREDSLAQRHLVSNLSYELKLRLGLFSTTPLTATLRCPEIIAKLATVSFKFFAFKTIVKWSNIGAKFLFNSCSRKYSIDLNRVQSNLSYGIKLGTSQIQPQSDSIWHDIPYELNFTVVNCWSGEFGLVPQLQVDLNRDRESQRV